MFEHWKISLICFFTVFDIDTSTAPVVFLNKTFNPHC